SGGTSPFSYSIDGNDFTNTTGSFTGLMAGDYTIYVRDANWNEAGDTGCETSVAVTIGEPDAIVLAEPTVTDVTCNGGSDGSVSVSVTSGGTSPFSYSIDNFATSNTTGIFTGLTAGNYTITVRDNNWNEAGDTGCETSVGVTVGEPDPIVLATPTVVDATCNAGSDGSVSVSVTSGGTSPFSYSIDGNDFTNTTGSFTGLMAGDY
ncbi:hypothetical protein, partial [uncultured Eudoraea sp.]|uniref:SprB repeat-containing protein n=1 Tax=uncultured Eudoraea sp. TaxID=1035614 RepID=UPI00260D5C7B